MRERPDQSKRNNGTQRDPFEGQTFSRHCELVTIKDAPACGMTDEQLAARRVDGHVHKWSNVSGRRICYVCDCVCDDEVER